MNKLIINSFFLLSFYFFDTGPIPQSPTIFSPEILASTFSNISLTCRIDDDGTCPQGLFWFLDNKTTPLVDGEKYKMEERETHTQCKKDFILTIFNVTENDEGRYSCHWVCEYEETKKADIDLKVFVELSPTGNNLSISLC